MKNKKGWIMILEATIAILIVCGALLIVYSQQVDERVSLEEYYDSVQGQILAEVSERSDLRLNVLNVEDENFGDENFVALIDFIDEKIPLGFGFLIRVCNLGDDADYCNMDNVTFIETLDKDIYVEEIMISAELGSGTDAVYNPKKLRLFVWEGENIGVDCNNTCSSVGSIFSCSADSTQILMKTCGNFDDDYCLEYDGEFEVFETCGEDEECVGNFGICTEIADLFILTCERTVVSIVDPKNETVC